MRPYRIHCGPCINPEIRAPMCFRPPFSQSYRNTISCSHGICTEETMRINASGQQCISVKVQGIRQYKVLMYVCMHAYIYTWHVYIYTHKSINTWINQHVYMYIYICIYTCIYAYICTCKYIYVYIYTYVGVSAAMRSPFQAVHWSLEQRVLQRANIGVGSGGNFVARCQAIP